MNDQPATTNAAIFAAINRGLRHRQDLSFWGMSRSIRLPVVKEEDAGFGSWFAETFIGDRGEMFGLACSVQPGEVKVGITLTRARKNISDDELRAICPDFRLPDIRRSLRALTLFDWVYRDGACAPEWFHKAYAGDLSARTMLESIIASIVVNTWKGAATFIADKYKIFQNEYLITSPTEIDVAILMKNIDGMVDHNAHQAGIGHMIILCTNETAEAVEAAARAICQDASLVPSA